MAERNNQQNTPKRVDDPAQKDEQPASVVSEAKEQPDPAKEQQAKETEEAFKASVESDDPKVSEPAKEILREQVNAEATEDGEYRLLEGRTHVADGKVLKAGSVVKLTAQQARAFKDKFEKA